MSVSGPCFVNHHAHSTINSQFLRKPQKRWLFSLTPKCGIMLTKNIKRRCRFTWYSWVLISVIYTTVFCANVDQFRLGPRPTTFFLDQFRTGSRPITLWYLFSIWLTCKLTILRAAGCGLRAAGCRLRAAGHIWLLPCNKVITQENWND